MEPTLHPNLAKLAAAYDEVLNRYGRGQINAAQARAEIMALEARDDQGVRWSIDPDSGEWVRRTALGGAQVDAPPQWGYETPDAFDFTRDPVAFNPNDRIAAHAVDESLMYAPAGLAGATRAAQPAPTGDTGWRALLSGMSRRTKVLIGVAALLGVVVAATHHSSSAPTTPLPHPTTTSTPATGHR